MPQWVHIDRRCGIYYLDINNTGPAQANWLPLVNVTANARISNYSGNVTLTQTFVPPSSNAPNAKIPEAKYSFPVYPSSSVVSFVARVKLDGSVVKTIRGVVKTLPTAKKEYKEAVARGETAGFLEQVEEDVFTMSLGNIPRAKGTEVEVDVGYVTELKHDSEVDGIRFTIPTAIAPRYGESSTGVSSTSGTHVRDGLAMNIEIDMPGPVMSVQSPSHPIAVIVGSHSRSADEMTDSEFDNKLAFARLSQSTAYLEKDFILQVLCRDSAAPKALLETNVGANGAVDSAALMLTFVPKFVIPPAAGKKVRKEIIFMVDRSGSMYDKIDPLKSALKVFLKSLPPNDGTRFDICSFGSRFSFLFDEKRTGERPGSRLYSQASLKIALDHVEGISANYGGTEILAPLKSACDRVLKRNKERSESLAAGKVNEEDHAEWETEVLLLTDGEVWDTAPLFNLVREHTQEWRAEGKRADGRAGIRVFTLGIGRDVSHGFVEGLAKAGGGYCMTVGDNERFEGKVVRMLKAALGQRTGGYKLTFDGMEEWGVTSSETSNTAITESDDDFEMVDDPMSTTKKAEPVVQAPISLFDTTANPDSVHENTSKPAVTTLIPPALIHTPHIIPPLFPFNRTTVYLLLSPRKSSSSLPLPKNVQLRAVTSSGQPLEITIPVTGISTPNSKTLHQLATKKYLDDLKAGESWIHSACQGGKTLECISGEGELAKKSTIKLHPRDTDDFNEDEFEEIVKREGERIGVQWGVVGKWTAFVALEETDAGQKPLEDTKAPVTMPPSPGSILPQARGGGGVRLMARGMQHSAGTLYGGGGAANVVAGMAAPPAPSAMFASYGAPRGMSASFGSAAPRGMYTAYASAAPAPPPPPPPGCLYGSRAAVSDISSLTFGASVSDEAGQVERSREKSKKSAGPPLQRQSMMRPQQQAQQQQQSMMQPQQQAQQQQQQSMMRPQQQAQQQQQSIMQPLQQAQRYPTSDADAAGKLIDLQDFEGFWEISSALLVNLWSKAKTVEPRKLNSENLKEVAGKQLGIPDSTDQQLKERILATSLVLVWFQHRLAGEKDTWELVFDKGNDWLAANAGGNVDNALAKAKEILEIA